MSKIIGKKLYISTSEKSIRNDVLNSSDLGSCELITDVSSTLKGAKKDWAFIHDEENCDDFIMEVEIKQVFRMKNGKFVKEK